MIGDRTCRDEESRRLMIDPVLLAGRLLIAAVVMTFRFIGCASIAGIEDPPPAIAKTKYSDLVTANPKLVSFWRLNEQASGSSSGGPAADKNGLNPGTYHGKVYQPANDLLGGDDDANTATGFDGSTGYVSVPFSSNLNSAEFTVEALVSVGGNLTPKIMTIVSSLDVAGKTGYALQFDDSAFVATVGDGTSLRTVVVEAQVQPDERCYVALMYDGTNVGLYVNPEAFDLVRGTHTFDYNAFKLGDASHKSYNYSSSSGWYKPQTS